jgi:hypothetical protein
MSEKEKIDAYYAGYVAAIKDAVEEFDRNFYEGSPLSEKQILANLREEAVGNKEEEE